MIRGIAIRRCRVYPVLQARVRLDKTYTFLEMNYNYNYRPVKSDYVPINNNYSYMSGPLEANGKSWKEVRNEQRARLAVPKRPSENKKQNTRTLKRMNGKRNLTRRRKNKR